MAEDSEASNNDGPANGTMILIDNGANNGTNLLNYLCNFEK